MTERESKPTCDGRLEEELGDDHRTKILYLLTVKIVGWKPSTGAAMLKDRAFGSMHVIALLTTNAIRLASERNDVHVLTRIAQSSFINSDTQLCRKVWAKEWTCLL
jgi:hypothetical protein